MYSSDFYTFFQEQVRKDVFLPAVAKSFPKFVKLLEQAGSYFLAPSGLTYVDFVVAEYLQTLGRNDPEVFYKYPELSAFVERVYALPQLKKHLATRKDTN
jgi:glutathione S-transferase